MTDSVRELTTEALSPFGLLVQLADGTAFESIEVAQLEDWIALHGVVVLRGVKAMAKEHLPGAARRLGPLQPWSFGSVHELKPDPSAANYLYTRREVPLHWDGAFAARVPHYLVFHCVEAPGPGCGGATVFVDTRRAWDAADIATRDRWRALQFRYATEHRAHYGGSFTQKLVAQHPDGGTVLRFAEPVDDLNPVQVDAEGLNALDSATMITTLRESLYQPDVLLEHTWETGDVVIADNHALLHGRRAFDAEAPRHLRRVNVLDRDRSFWDALRDSFRIRRPEFMVAEIPILLIAALTSTGGRWAPLGTGLFAVLVVLFFLLYHFGDMVNCYADRDLDAVYKTKLSEAVYGLGLGNVRTQMALTVGTASVLAAIMSAWLGRWQILGLVVAGLALGSQYSLPPAWLKGRGLLQVATLWLLIFVGPMLLVAVSLGSVFQPLWLLRFACYGAMQQGIILINTAEDLPEDRAMGIRTSAVALGFQWTVRGALALVTFGGGGVLWTLIGEGARFAAIPFALAWSWVAAELVLLGWGVRTAVSEAEALARLRPRARRMPLWITATAWGALITLGLT